MNITGVLILLFIVGLTLFISELWAKRGGVHVLIARKLLHITGIGAVAIAPALFTDLRLLSWILLGLSILLGFAVSQKWLAVDAQDRKSWGIALFPFAGWVLLQLAGSYQLYIMVYAMLILTFADAAAALVGGLYGKKYWSISGDPKSLLGSVAFVIFTLLVLLLLPNFLQQLHPVFNLPVFEGASGIQKIVLVLTFAIVVSLVEAATSGGWDNVTVPFVAAWLLAMLPSWVGSHFYMPLFTLILLCLLGMLAYNRGWLDAGGSLMAVLLGFFIWMGAGTNTLLLIGVFFLSSSLLSKLTAHKKLGATDSKHGKPRDYMQVLSNGAVAGICIVGYAITLYGGWLILFATSVAVSTADTWSSEAGNAAKGKVVDIIGFKPLPKGVSGGISWQGTIAGLLGAILIAWLAYIIGIDQPKIIACGGFAGMLLDSIMGSLLQAKYKNEQGMVTDIPENDNGRYPIKGFRWMTNDLVNLLSNLILVIFTGVFLYFTL